MNAAPDHNMPDHEALLRALRQAQHISRCQAVDLERAQLELAATRIRATAFARQQETTLLRAGRLEQALLRLQAEQARMTTLLSAQAVANPVSDDGLRAEIALLVQHREEARLLRQSLSWRVTRPLRALRRPRRTLRILLARFVGDQPG